MEVHVKMQAQNLKHNACAFGGRAPKKESYLLKGFQLLWYTGPRTDFRTLTIAVEWTLDALVLRLGRETVRNG